MAGLEISDVVGIGGNVIGSAFDVIGSFGAKKEAKRQLEAGRRQAGLQRIGFEETYDDLLGLANRQNTYKGDISRFKRAESEALKQQTLASKANPADEIYRENARQDTSNFINSASRGARSGVDLMSIAGAGAGLEGRRMRDINARSAELAFRGRESANTRVLSSLRDTASASERERGREFDSSYRKSRDLLSLREEKGLGKLSLEDALFNQQQARMGALQDAKQSIWSGVGDIFRSVGTGLQSNINAQEKNKTL